MIIATEKIINSSPSNFNDKLLPKSKLRTKDASKAYSFQVKLPNTEKTSYIR